MHIHIVNLLDSIFKHCAKKEVPIKDLFSKCNLFTFTEGSLNAKINFLYSKA